MKWKSRWTRWMPGMLLMWSSLLFAAPTVDLYLPEAPPLTMLTVGDRHGITGDIAIKAMALAGYSPRFVSPPWSRAQRDVSQGKNLLITPLSRTQQRENMYTWIAPILTMDRAFFSLTRRVETFEEAKNAFRLIAVGLGSAQETRLRDEGFAESQIYPLKIGENPAQLLLKGRVDAWFNGVPETRHIWAQISDRPLVMSRVLMTADLYLACSKDCDPKMVESLRNAVDTLEDNGTLRTVEESYLRGLPVW